MRQKSFEPPDNAISFIADDIKFLSFSFQVRPIQVGIGTGLGHRYQKRPSKGSSGLFLSASADNKLDRQSFFLVYYGTL